MSRIGHASAGSPLGVVRETGHMVGAMAVGGAIGALLGVGHARFGLDTPGGPVDGWVAGLSALASIVLGGMGHQTAAGYARAAANDAFVVLSFRKSFEFMHGGGGGMRTGGIVRIPGGGGNARMSGSVLSGETKAPKVDPREVRIEAAARAL